MSFGAESPLQDPLRSALEDWRDRTPLVTRCLLGAHAATYLASWLVDLEPALANVPRLTLGSFQVHRIFLSPLVNSSLFSLLLAVLGFGEFGRRLERSLGSATFGWMGLLLGLASNLLFLLLSCLLSLIFGAYWMAMSASGLWLVYLGLLAVACVHAPSDMPVRLCLAQVPVLYFPLALYGLFVLFGGGSVVGHALSLGLGYAMGQDRIDMAKLSPARAKQWENTVLSPLTRQRGWVHGHAATGVENGWDDAGDGTMVLPLFGAPDAGADSSDGSVAAPSGDSSGVVSLFGSGGRPGPAAAAAVGEPSSGRVLGGATRRGKTDARAARLLALDRKVETNEM